MKKKWFKISIKLILWIQIVRAQEAPSGRVGINVEQPSATLEVKASQNLYANEGIIAPKLGKQRVADIREPVEGTLLYVEDLQYNGASVKVNTIDERGYYYYDGTMWQKLANSSSSKWWNLKDSKEPEWEEVNSDSSFYFTNGFVKGEGRSILIYGDIYNLENGSPILCESSQGRGMPFLKVKARFVKINTPKYDIKKYAQGEKEFLLRKEQLENVQANYEIYENNSKVIVGCPKDQDLMVRLGTLYAIKY
ncbi:hypothetical protein EDL99_04155 [Ornithobacterium rhinotracheale]|uniref:hypothetical protein n=1 Tax=Ornithobacterium rhinotracheale TaxID=28251 RepID=UPI00129C2BB2|nr:hypothetical protein [Ornithobacterium rhinotracheale]MRJ08081.1 hypothetical protein [Ornithobacterium rhinotracheale]UOH78411.1 hypothetical protein MT996_02830 [Ornithobacterium rhinotracheale]